MSTSDLINLIFAYQDAGDVIRAAKVFNELADHVGSYATAEALILRGHPQYLN